MLKIISKRVLSCVVILCLALSSIAVTVYSESETVSNPSVTVSGIQKFIVKALAADTEKREIVASAIDKIKEYTPEQAKEKAKELVDLIGATLNDEDLELLVNTFYNMSDNKKAFINGLIRIGYTTSSDFSKFRSIANMINVKITGNESDDNGTKFLVSVLESFSQGLIPLTTVYDLDGDIGKIKLELNVGSDTKKSINSLIGDLLVCVDDLPEQYENNKNIDYFLLRAQNSINNINNVKNEVIEFKKFLENENGRIYAGSFAPTPTPVPSNGGGNNGGGTVATPTATTVATATPTPTAVATATPTSKPTATPTIVVGPTTKQITAFSFKNIPGSKGVIFERIHTIIVKVPEGTDLKTLEPIIEFKGASIRPESGVKKNFKNPVFYTVTAVDKSKVKYVVMVEAVKDKDKDKVVIEPRQVMPGTQYGPFGDIFGHWAEERIISMIENGAIAGYPDGSVKPDIDMTRAEVITSLIKAIGLEPAKNPKLKFADIKSIPDWAHGYIQVALDKGIIAGYPDNTYKANNKVTRSEFLVMAMKAFTYQTSKNTTLKFKDTKDIPSWAIGYVAKAVETTIIEGYKEDNTIKPNKRITRAEVMTIIDKCITLSAKK